MTEIFTLHPQLNADTFAVCDLPLCTVRLMNDADHPWVILIPKRPNITEIFDLTSADQATLYAEITATAQVMKSHFNAHKMNIGALGNMVPQLHIHIIARQKTDPTFPNPVWGNSALIPYTNTEQDKILAELQGIL